MFQAFRVLLLAMLEASNLWEFDFFELHFGLILDTIKDGIRNKVGVIIKVDTTNLKLTSVWLN